MNEKREENSNEVRTMDLLYLEWLVSIQCLPEPCGHRSEMISLNMVVNLSCLGAGTR
jgi:hypothetical protein